MLDARPEKLFRPDTRIRNQEKHETVQRRQEERRPD